MPIFNRKSDEFFCEEPNQFNFNFNEVYSINSEEVFEDILDISFNNLQHDVEYFLSDFCDYMFDLIDNLISENDDFHKELYNMINEYIDNYTTDKLLNYTSFQDAIDNLMRCFRNSLNIFNKSNGQKVIVYESRNDITITTNSDGNLVIDL